MTIQRQRILAWSGFAVMTLIVSWIALGHPGPPDLPYKFAPMPFESYAWMIPCLFDPTCGGTRWILKLIAINGFGNVVVFMPIGITLYIALMLSKPDQRVNRRIIVATLIGLSISLVYEIIQIWIPGRVVATDDLITNTSGTALGAISTWLAFRLWRAAQGKLIQEDMHDG
jgi:hypothetical protein